MIQKRQHGRVNRFLDVFDDGHFCFGAELGYLEKHQGVRLALGRTHGVRLQADYERDILFFQELDADMVGIGPFIPNADTPLGTATGGEFHLSRRFVSLLRLLLPEANIPATTAMESLQPDARMITLRSGANVVMPNATEGEYRRKYALYPGKICVDDTPKKCRGCIGGKITAIGRHIAGDYGFRQRRQ